MKCQTKFEQCLLHLPNLYVFKGSQAKTGVGDLVAGNSYVLTWLLLAYYKLGSTKQETPLVEFSRATIKLQARMTLLGMSVLSSQELRHMCQTWFKDNCVLVWNSGVEC